MNFRFLVLILLLACCVPGCASTLADEIYAWDPAPIKRAWGNLKNRLAHSDHDDPAPDPRIAPIPACEENVSPPSPVAQGLWAELSVDRHTLIARARIRNGGPGECLLSGLSGAGAPTTLLLVRTEGGEREPVPPVVLWRGVQPETRLSAGDEITVFFDLKSAYGPLAPGDYHVRLRGIPSHAAAFTVAERH